MKFFIPHCKPRVIKSSMKRQAGQEIKAQNNVVSPKIDKFAKKRKAQMEDIDEDIRETNKLLKKSLEKIVNEKILENNAKEEIESPHL